ncbi:unnamed protein product [Rhizophagus irregularis]|nr:unnamed protein product [Rhizophagus irregularis]
MSVNDNYDFNFILESVTLTGKRIRLEPLIPSVHAEELYEVSHVNPESRKVFDYLPYGPFNTYQEFLNFLNGPRIKGDNHTILFCIIDIVSEKKIGIAGYLDTQPIHKKIELVIYGSYHHFNEHMLIQKQIFFYYNMHLNLLNILELHGNVILIILIHVNLLKD